MKKLSRIAALLAAGATLLMVGAGFVSCSEDEEEDNSPKLTISADSAVSVEAGEPIDVTLTATLKNDSFAGAIPSGVDLSAYVTVTPSNAASFENDLAVTAAEDIAAGGTTAKVNVSVTTTAAAVSGTLKVTIAGEALKSGKDLTSNSLSYTIAGTSGGGTDPVTAGATISFNANDDEPSVALTNTSDSSIFSNVQNSFGAYVIGSDFTIFTANDATYASAKFSVSNANNAKLSNYTVDTDNKVSMKGWLESATSSDSTNGITIAAEGAVIAYTTYTFTLAQAATVSASSVAFNGQSGNVYGQISILDSSSTVKATATGTVASKEDNDASIASVDLAAGTYTVKLAWITSGASKTYKKWNCGIEKFTLTASAD